MIAGKARGLNRVFKFHEKAGLCVDGCRTDIKKSVLAECQVCQEKSDTSWVSFNVACGLLNIDYLHIVYF
jgi:hypothetical protein